MEKPFKFLLPSPSFDKKPSSVVKAKPHFLTPSGMTLLPREKQPPPMYGQKGATVPARYLKAIAAETPVLQEPVKQYCEPCELELQSLDDYKRHRAQHENCPVAGCQYKGHPTVMDKHITALHSSGLFEKFKKLSSPEEIAAWREERRKRYPTVANVEMKQKAQEQRQKRGERLEASKNRFGKVEDKKRAQTNSEEVANNQDNKQNYTKPDKKQKNKNRNKRNRKGKQDARNDDKPKKGVESGKSNESTQENDNCPDLVMFGGTLQMEDYKRETTKPKTATKNVLFGLVGMYGSDDDDESEEDQDNAANENQFNIQGACGLNLVKNCETDVKEKTQNIEASIEGNQNEDAKDVIPNKNHCKDTCADQDIIHERSIENIEMLRPTTENTSIEYSLSITNNTSTGVYCTEQSSDISPTPIQIKSVTCSKVEFTDPPNGNKHLPLEKSYANSSDEAPEETPIQRSIPEYKITTEQPTVSNLTPSNKTEVPSQKSNKQSKDNNIRTRQMLKRKSGLDYRKLKLRKQNTMLEKLLESDIRRERNVLLQCVRYVCENNFFGVGTTAGNKTPID